MNEKEAVLQGVFWKFAEHFSAQLVSLVVSVILARLLDPGEYGIISLVTVFIAIANTFVTSGFGLALIQKKEVDSVDYSSVLYFTLVFSGVVYFLLFFLAIPISDFYEIPVLKPVLRVLSISVPIMGMNSIQQAYISKNMEFKKFFRATIIGTMISAIVGICMAYMGFGVWALVAQTLTNNIVDTIILQLTIEWKPTREFSFSRIASLLNYGWKLLVQSLIAQMYASLRSLLIGKIYTATDLAYYNKGIQFPNLISTNIDTAINTVLFSAMSRAQDSVETVKSMARKATQLTSYMMSPLLIGFIAVATHFINCLLTDKWLMAVPFLRIGCVVLLFRAPQTGILQALKALGKSDSVLKCDVPIRIFAILILLFSIRFGVIYFALSEIATTILGTIIYAVAAKKYVRYNFREIAEDFMVNIARASVMGLVVWLFGLYLPFGDFWTMMIQIALGVLIYVFISLITKSTDCFYLMETIREFFNKRRLR